MAPREGGGLQDVPPPPPKKGRDVDAEGIESGCQKFALAAPLQHDTGMVVTKAIVKI